MDVMFFWGIIHPGFPNRDGERHRMMNVERWKRIFHKLGLNKIDDGGLGLPLRSKKGRERRQGQQEGDNLYRENTTVNCLSFRSRQLIFCGCFVLPPLWSLNLKMNLPDLPPRETVSQQKFHNSPTAETFCSIVPSWNCNLLWHFN